MTGDQIWELIAFLAAVVIFIPIFYRFKVNPLLAFIAAGVILGPHGLGVIKDMKVADNVGELGLLFLMFSIGLDLSFHRFKAMREYIFGYGAAQMAITAVIFGAVAYLLHKSVNEAIIIGVALAMSSTAVALRLMQGRAEMRVQHGNQNGENQKYENDVAVFEINKAFLFAVKGQNRKNKQTERADGQQ